MSTRPGYYSGRGATITDLSSIKLERVYRAILDHEGEFAAEAFVKMVAAIPVLSATAFLLNLIRLDAREYQFDGIVEADGIYAENEGEAFGTLVSVFSREMDRDETIAIRNPFLTAHGVKVPDAYDFETTNDGITIRRKNARKRRTAWDRIKNG